MHAYILQQLKIDQDASMKSKTRGLMWHTGATQHSGAAAAEEAQGEPESLVQAEIQVL